MEAISIEVPLETAKGWLEVPKAKRNKLAVKFREQIELEVNNTRKERLYQAMDNLASEAKRNGLTPEILEEILKSDD